MILFAFLLALPQAELVPIAAFGISSNGKVVYGSIHGLPCTWTRSGGVKKLPLPKGILGGLVTAASADGSTLAGFVSEGELAYICRWANGSPLIITQYASQGTPAVSQDGSTIVGEWGVEDERHYLHGRGVFRWTSKTGLVKLPPLVADLPQCGCNGCSADGSIVVGWASVPPIIHMRRNPGGTGPPPDEGRMIACIWDSKGKPMALPRPPGFLSTRAWSCSFNGKVIAGTGNSNGDRALIWKSGQNTNPVALESLGKPVSGPIYVASDGKTVFGYATENSDMPISRSEP
ncbi:MAG TPA: hypothetical protein VG944_11090, partial [Fimbriimonas sp.]|nr:hypothetical protein [Fimbriimonas sp.]